jgi:structural maintenance of chromosome 2
MNRHCLQEIDVLSGQLSNLDFSFSDPYPKFDRSKVKGLVAKLIKIDPDNLQYTTALQVCAEGRLFFVSLIFMLTAFNLLA